MPEDERSSPVRTKIVATVGPASESQDTLAALVGAGASVFRLNMSHADPEWRERVLGRIRAVSEALDVPIAVLADLGGPKIRLAAVPEGERVLVADETLVLAEKPDAGGGQPPRLGTNHPGLVGQLREGDRVLLADGTVGLEVVSTRAGEAVCRVTEGGPVRSGSGLNLPGVDLDVDSLTEADLEDLRWLAEHEVEFVGQSFVRRSADVRRLREELRRLDCAAQIVAKIEKPQAVEALDPIIAEADAVMVARGDLGVEIDVARMATVQKEIIRRCNRAGVPVITATQMLESMRSSRLPTRAEATDVANAVIDGTDALMLSAETAIGDHPALAVEMMSRIAREAERLLPPAARGGPAAPAGRPSVDLAMVEGASFVAERVGARMIVVASESGRTALALSKQRNVPLTLGVSDRAETARRMCLYWGVTPRLVESVRHSPELLDHVLGWARGRGLVAPGDPVVLIANTNWTATGHNMIVVREVS